MAAKCSEEFLHFCRWGGARSCCFQKIREEGVFRVSIKRKQRKKEKEVEKGCHFCGFFLVLVFILSYPYHVYKVSCYLLPNSIVCYYENYGLSLSWYVNRTLLYGHVSVSQFGSFYCRHFIFLINFWKKFFNYFQFMRLVYGKKILTVSLTPCTYVWHLNSVGVFKILGSCTVQHLNLCARKVSCKLVLDITTASMVQVWWIWMYCLCDI